MLGWPCSFLDINGVHVDFPGDPKHVAVVGTTKCLYCMPHRDWKPTAMTWSSKTPREKEQRVLHFLGCYLVFSRWPNGNDYILLTAISILPVRWVGSLISCYWEVDATMNEYYGNEDKLPVSPVPHQCDSSLFCCDPWVTEMNSECELSVSATLTVTVTWTCVPSCSIASSVEDKGHQSSGPRRVQSNNPHQSTTTSQHDLSYMSM